MITHLQTTTKVLHALPVARTAAFLESAVEAIVYALKTNNKVMFCGNGGSAAMAGHLAAELSGRFAKDRPGLAALALTDSTIITAVANDYAFARIFSRQISALARPGDVLVAMSTSGRSENVLRAIEQALIEGMSVIGLTGDGYSPKMSPCDIFYAVPSDDTAVIQEVHLVLGHAICGEVERRMFP